MYSGFFRPSICLSVAALEICASDFEDSSIQSYILMNLKNLPSGFLLNNGVLCLGKLVLLPFKVKNGRVCGHIWSFSFEPFSFSYYFPIC